jgi:hypothetical protein
MTPEEAKQFFATVTHDVITKDDFDHAINAFHMFDFYSEQSQSVEDPKFTTRYYVLRLRNSQRNTIETLDWEGPIEPFNWSKAFVIKFETGVSKSETNTVKLALMYFVNEINKDKILE